MRRIPESSRTARAGFTLIELLIVIGIIAVLVSLTAAGVMRVRQRAFELQMRSDISQLSVAVQQFNVANNVNYFPSYIILKNDGNYNASIQIELESYKFLKSVWPRLQFPVFNASSKGWFPDDPAASLTSSYTLTGDQCLVFFLGGIQSGGSCQGFSANASNPTVLTGTRKQLFDFPTARLFPTSNGPYTAFVFLDAMKEKPYAYFSSYGNQNGYNRYAAILSTSDCPSLITAGAYKDANNNYYNKDSFQIICAGIDKTFGQAANGQWDIRSGLPFSQGTDGYDDLCNFHDKIMGSGAQ